MEELQSVGLGLAIGVLVILALSRFPGEPFDYASSSILSSSDGAQTTLSEQGEDPADVSAPTCMSPPDSQQLRQPAEGEHGDMCGVAGDVRAAQRRRVRELQALLGVERLKVTALAARADATEGRRSPTPSVSSSTSYSARLDAAFYVLTLATLVYVLQSEYGIDALHAVARVFPREVETATNVLSAPARLLQLFTW